MNYTDEMYHEDCEKWKDRDIVCELKYMGENPPERLRVTYKDIRFYSWLCRKAAERITELEKRE